MELQSSSGGSDVSLKVYISLPTEVADPFLDESLGGTDKLLGVVVPETRLRTVLGLGRAATFRGLGGNGWDRETNIEEAPTD